MALLRRVTSSTLLFVGLLGMLVGFCVGYVMMGTLHAVFEVGAIHHYADGMRKIHPASNQHQYQHHHKAARHKEEAARAISRRTSWLTQGKDVHVLVTSNGSPYQNFQTRIMYGTYKLVQQEPGGKHMVAFTRILHRVKPDVLMEEVPTHHVTPLHPGCDTWCEFPVADRPNAVAQFLSAAEADPSLIAAPWVLLIEADYVFVRPVAAPEAASPALSIGFPFGYIQPQAPAIRTVMERLYPPETGPLSDVPSTGPAPVLMRPAELMKVTPDWERLTLAIETDPESKEKLGWVREMYAFSMALALSGVHLDLQLPPSNRLIVQPPADFQLGEAAAMHYTWGTIYKDPAGKDVWSFDKRFYTDEVKSLKVDPLPMPPPFDAAAGLTISNGNKVTPAMNKLVASMISQMNRAIATLPDLRGNR